MMKIKSLDEINICDILTCHEEVEPSDSKTIIFRNTELGNEIEFDVCKGCFRGLREYFREIIKEEEEGDFEY